MSIDQTDFPDDRGTAASTPIFDRAAAHAPAAVVAPSRPDAPGPASTATPSPEGADGARAAGHAAAQAGAHVAGTAKDQATKVASSALDQAKDLYERFTDQLSMQAEEQQGHAARALKSASEDLRTMHEASDGGLAGQLVQELARRAGAAGTWLDERDPAEVLDEVRRYAGRRPVVFAGAAVLTGVAAGRLVKALAARKRADAGAATPAGTP